MEAPSSEVANVEASAKARVRIPSGPQEAGERDPRLRQQPPLPYSTEVQQPRRPTTAGIAHQYPWGNLYDLQCLILFELRIRCVTGP